jgi:hypothetical protein
MFTRGKQSQTVNLFKTERLKLHNNKISFKRFFVIDLNRMT